MNPYRSSRSFGYFTDESAPAELTATRELRGAGGQRLAASSAKEPLKLFCCAKERDSEPGGFQQSPL